MATEELQRLRDELRSLYRRLDEFEDDTESIITRSYVESVREAIARIEEVVGEFDLDDAGAFAADASEVANVRLATLKSVEATEVIWEAWSERLERIGDYHREVFEAVTGAPVIIDEPWLRELKGQWPTPGEPGTGMAGSFYSMSDHHRRELADAVTRQVLAGSDPRQLRKELQEKLGIAERQATQHVRDATIQFSRGVNARKSKDLGFERYQYFGPDDSITRPFCDPRVGRVFSREEIREMNNGQTGAGSVMIAGGGYNCRHRWQPVQEGWFDADEWQRLRGDG